MKTHDEMTNVLLKRRDIYIQQQNERRKAMKKTLKRTMTSIGCIALAAALGIGLWQADLFKNSQSNKPAKNESTQQEAENITQNQETTSPTVETEEPNVSSNEEVVNEERPTVPKAYATGGIEADWTFYDYYQYDFSKDIYDNSGNQLTPYCYTAYPSLTELSPYLNETELEEYIAWREQFWLKNKETYTRTDAPDLIKFIDELGLITKEEFMEIVENQKASYIPGTAYPQYYFLTQEEIDLIFSEDHALRDSSLVSPYAIFAVDDIYNIVWFDTHNAEDYIEAGVTKQQLLEIIPTWEELNGAEYQRQWYVDLERIKQEVEKMPEQAN